MGNIERVLSALSLNVASGDGTYNGFSILLTHTSASALSTNFDNNYGGNQPTVVFSRASHALNSTPAGWKPITFDTPFVYNGTDNLLIEIRWTSGSGTTITRATLESGNRRALFASVHATTGTLQNFRTVLQLAFTDDPIHNISGFVQTATGAGVEGVRMEGLPGGPVTTADGHYSAPVANGWSGHILPVLNGYVFNPFTHSYTNVTEDQTDQNFAAYSTAGMEPQSVSATYTNGDIPTDFDFRGPQDESGEPGILSVPLPNDAVIIGVDVSYEMTAHNNGWMSEQRSWLRCVSPGGIGEPQAYSGVGLMEGTYSYSRTGLNIANGVRGGGDVIFELHAGRTFGDFTGGTVSTHYNKVDDGTWTVTVHYLEMSLLPQIKVAPTAFEVTEGETGQFWVHLPVAPQNTVDIEVQRVSGSTNIVVESGATLQFTPENGTNALPVTIHARPDANWTNDVAVFVCVDPAGTHINSSYITVTEIDIDVDPSTLLPFHENFDDPDKASIPGPLSGQHGWRGGDGAIVTAGAGLEAGNALQLTSDYAAKDFVNGTNQVVISTWMKAHGGEIPSNIPDNASAVFWVDTNNHVNVYNHDEVVVLPLQVPPDEYSHFEIRVDYTAGTWGLDVNETTAFENFGTYSSQPRFTGIEFRNTAATPAYFDDIHISSDTASSVVSFSAWLEQFQLPPDTSETAISANGYNTMREAYIAGIDPTDPNAQFKIESSEPVTGDNIVVQWEGVEGRRYNVYWSSNLLHGAGFERIASDIPYHATSFTNIMQNGQGFYRIDVQLDQ